MTMSLLPAALRIAEARDAKLPKGLEWGLRSVHPDFTSSRGYRWPFPGRYAVAPGPCTESADPCPAVPGDGLSVGLSWYGITSGGIPATVVLLVGCRSEDVLGRNQEKLRARRVYVADVLTIESLLEERAADESLDLRFANLSGANFRAADLRGADFSFANVSFANFSRANLSGANFSRADVNFANFNRANLSGANFSRADLIRANLVVANLSDTKLIDTNLRDANLVAANLIGADLGYADLGYANLIGADLSRANLIGANLIRADLSDANLTGAVFTDGSWMAPSSKDHHAR